MVSQTNELKNIGLKYIGWNYIGYWPEEYCSDNLLGTQAQGKNK